MKTVDLSSSDPTLAELLELASDETVILRTSEGREFVLAEVDDFEAEVAAVSQHQELLSFLDRRSREGRRYSLSEVREQLRAE